MNLPFFHQSVADCEAAFKDAPNENAAEVWAFFGGVARIEASLLFAMGLSSVYALTVPLQKREALAVFIGIASILCALCDANAAGLVPQYGGVSWMVPRIGKELGNLVPVWCIIAPCMFLSILLSPPDG